METSNPADSKVSAEDRGRQDGERHLIRLEWEGDLVIADPQPVVHFRPVDWRKADRTLSLIALSQALLALSYILLFIAYLVLTH